MCLRNWFLVMGVGVGVRWSVSFDAWYTVGFMWRGAQEGRRKVGKGQSVEVYCIYP